MKPLVSILITAYNAEKWIGYTLESAVNQTWPRKEIIVVDDGSRDRTPEMARRFASKNVRVVSTENRGHSSAANYAFKLCQGDYIQELDADDLLSPDKIEKQVVALQEVGDKRILASSPWASFYFRANRAQFVPNSLWQDLSPVEWLLRKMGENLHMGNSTWLASREVVEAAGHWDGNIFAASSWRLGAHVLSQRAGCITDPVARTASAILETRRRRWNRFSAQ